MMVIVMAPKTLARIACTSVLALALAGCIGDAAPTVTASTAPPSVDMVGRWALTAGGATTCAVNLTSTGPTEGAVRPEGGCAGKFFTSRKWDFDGPSLVIRDHNDQPLAHLKQIVAGRYEGQATNGQPVSLVH
jgi:hypothetical protein